MYGIGALDPRRIYISPKGAVTLLNAPRAGAFLEGCRLFLGETIGQYELGVNNWTSEKPTRFESYAQRCGNS